MRLVILNRFELDLPSLLAVAKEEGVAKTNAVIDFTLQDATPKSRGPADGQSGEGILVELINPELMTCTGILKALNKTKTRFVIAFTAIHKSQFLNISFEVDMNGQSATYSVETLVKLSSSVEPVGKLSMPALKFKLLASLLRSYKNNAETAPVCQGDTYQVEIIDDCGQPVTYPLLKAALSRLQLLEKTGEDSYEINIDRGARMLKYIARANELVTRSIVAEVSDL